MVRITNYAVAAIAGFALAGGAVASQVVSQGPVTQLMLPTVQGQASDLPVTIDFANAKELPMPNPGIASPSMMEILLSRPTFSLGASGSAEGGVGTGTMMPVQLTSVVKTAQTDNPISPQEFGTSGQTFTTNRVNALGDNTQYYYPYRAAGKLFFNIGSATYVCSASMIKPGVLVTAAHCVAAFGQSKFYSNWVYVPAYNNGSAPYSTWTASSAVVMTTYYNGTDSCAVSGVVCQNDVAVLTMTPKSGVYVGSVTGWFGYGYGGYSYNSSNQVLIDQLGYPVALDGGNLMQRNDSQGYVAPSMSNNTIIGSLMTGGSSGGPWLVNLGIAPALSGTGFGTAPARNTVVGVTSWGYVSTAVKQQGASPFTSGNIVPLINTACSIAPAGC